MSCALESRKAFTGWSCGIRPCILLGDVFSKEKPLSSAGHVLWSSPTSVTTGQPGLETSSCVKKEWPHGGVGLGHSPKDWALLLQKLISHCDLYLGGSNYAGSRDQLQLNLWSYHKNLGMMGHSSTTWTGSWWAHCRATCQVFITDPLSDAQTTQEVEDWAGSLALDHLLWHFSLLALWWFSWSSCWCSVIPR